MRLKTIKKSFGAVFFAFCMLISSVSPAYCYVDWNGYTGYGGGDTNPHFATTPVQLYVEEEYSIKVPALVTMSEFTDGWGNKFLFGRVNIPTKLNIRDESTLHMTLLGTDTSQTTSTFTSVNKKDENGNPYQVAVTVNGTDCIACTINSPIHRTVSDNEYIPSIDFYPPSTGCMIGIGDKEYDFIPLYNSAVDYSNFPEYSDFPSAGYLKVYVSDIPVFDMYTGTYIVEYYLESAM